jgi:hypothetical protein
VAYGQSWGECRTAAYNNTLFDKTLRLHPESAAAQPSTRLPHRAIGAAVWPSLNSDADPDFAMPTIHLILTKKSNPTYWGLLSVVLDSWKLVLG